MSNQDRNSLPPEPPLSDADFDAYLRRDSRVSQQYREQGSDSVPPPSLDRAVLSQAQAAASATKRSRLLRWSGPLALAASVVVVVSLVLEPAMQKEIAQTAAPAAAPDAAVLKESSDSQLRESQPLEMRLPQSADAMAPEAKLLSEPQPVPPSLALESLASEAERKAHSKAEQSRDQMANAARRAAPPPPVIDIPAYAAPAAAIRQTTSSASLPASGPAPAAASPPAVDSAGGVAPTDENSAALDEISVTAEKRRQRPGSAAGPRGTIPTSRARQAAEEDASDKLVEQANPSAWLERIRELRRAGHRTAADREWQQFVKQYPDYVVDAADLARPPRDK